MKKSNKPIIKYIPDFLDYLEVGKGLSDKTQENYNKFLKKFSLWLKINNLPYLKPYQLTNDHIWQYRVFLSRSSVSKIKRGLSKSTQNCYLIALRSLLNYFADHDILSLPAEKIKLAKSKTEKEIRFLNLDQIEKLLLSPKTSNIIGLRDRTILEALFSTGLRVAEMTALNREQIKIKDKTKYLEIGIIGKGGRARTIYFSERAVNWLRKYLETRKDQDKALFINYKKGSQKSSSRRLTPRSIENIVKKYATITGLPIMTSPHTIRHSYATDLLTQGVDLRLVQEFLGHRNIATTQIYTHVTNKRLRDIHRQFHSGKNLKE